MNRFSALALSFILLVEIIFFVRPASAAMSLSVSNVPPSVDQDQEFSTDVIFYCTSCTSDSFLRGIFYPSGTSYFGFTKDNNGNWVNAPGGSCTQYFKIAAGDIKEGSWSGQMQFKADSASSFYQGPGDYLFKIGRYTTSCGSPTWSSETTITVTGPSATPTPEPTNTSTPTQTPTLTPTSTPTCTPKPTNTPTPTNTIIPTRKPTPKIDPNQSEFDILGVSDSSPDSHLQTNEEIKPPVKPIAISLLLVGGGCGILSSVFVWKNRNALKHPPA